MPWGTVGEHTRWVGRHVELGLIVVSEDDVYFPDKVRGLLTYVVDGDYAKCFKHDKLRQKIELNTVSLEEVDQAIRHYACYWRSYRLFSRLAARQAYEDALDDQFKTF